MTRHLRPGDTEKNVSQRCFIHSYMHLSLCLHSTKQLQNGGDSSTNIWEAFKGEINGLWRLSLAYSAQRVVNSSWILAIG